MQKSIAKKIKQLQSVVSAFLKNPAEYETKKQTGQPVLVSPWMI